MDTIVREALHQDEPALLNLFADSFGHAMPVPLWRWKYHQPSSHATLVQSGNDMVAFYGGVVRTVLRFGKTATAVQIGDVMVAPAWRGKLTHRGPFFEAATGFISRWMQAQREYDFAFGFPSERACRLGVALKLYQPMDRIVEVQWPSTGAGLSLLQTVRPLTSNDYNAVNQLWQCMAQDLLRQVVGVRDAHYVQQRYVKHPTHQYQLMLVSRRMGGQALGVLVVRNHADHGLELMDLIAPLNNLPILVAAARRYALKMGLNRVFAWATPLVARSIAEPDGQVQNTEVVVPTIVWQQPESVAQLKDRWWLMGGDADFR